MKVKFPDREGKTIFLTLNENNAEEEKSQNDINSNKKTTKNNMLNVRIVLIKIL